MGNSYGMSDQKLITCLESRYTEILYRNLDNTIASIQIKLVEKVRSATEVNNSEDLIEDIDKRVEKLFNIEQEIASARIQDCQELNTFLEQKIELGDNILDKLSTKKN